MVQVSTLRASERHEGISRHINAGSLPYIEIVILAHLRGDLRLDPFFDVRVFAPVQPAVLLERVDDPSPFALFREHVSQSGAE